MPRPSSAAVREHAVCSCAAVPSLLSAGGAAPGTDQALSGVVIEAYLHEVNTRKVDDPLQTLGSTSVSPGPTSTRSSLQLSFGRGETACDDMPGCRRRSRVDLPGSTICICTVRIGVWLPRHVNVKNLICRIVGVHHALHVSSMSERQCAWSGTC